MYNGLASSLITLCLVNQAPPKVSIVVQLLISLLAACRGLSLQRIRQLVCTLYNDTGRHNVAYNDHRGSMSDWCMASSALATALLIEPIESVLIKSHITQSSRCITSTRTSIGHTFLIDCCYCHSTGSYLSLYCSLKYLVLRSVQLQLKDCNQQTSRQMERIEIEPNQSGQLCEDKVASLS